MHISGECGHQKMKKLRKTGIIIAVIFGLFCVSIPIIAGGYIFMNHQEENKESPKTKVTEKEKKLMEGQKADIELSLKYNYNGIKKVNLVKIEKTPMGYLIKGYVNDDKKLNFSAGVSDGKFDDTMSMSAELEDLAKFDTNKSLSEIKKEQQETSMTSPKKQTRSMEEILADARAREEQIFNRDRT